ncbi:MAG: ferrous iron transport protein A [bacterium]
MMPLNLLPLGKTGKIKELSLSGMIQRRLLDLGMIFDTEIKALLQSPAGDPTAYSVRGSVIALRSEESSHILIELI